MHHPMFTAGPEHPPALEELRHWLNLFRDNGVQAVFSGHEHNFQFSERNSRTGGLQFVVSGAGGQLRDGNIRSRMQRQSIGAWVPQNHFCVVEVTPDELLVTPLSYEPVKIIGANGSLVAIPLKMNRIMRRKY